MTGRVVSLPGCSVDLATFPFGSRPGLSVCRVRSAGGPWSMVAGLDIDEVEHQLSGEFPGCTVYSVATVGRIVLT